MLSGLIVVPAWLAVVGMFDHAEKRKAAAQARIRKVRIGGLLRVVGLADPGHQVREPVAFC
jgi:hypothetical protein